MRGHEPIFTHGDLQAKSILIRAEDGLPVLIDGGVRGLVPQLLGIY